MSVGNCVVWLVSRKCTGFWSTNKKSKSFSRGALFYVPNLKYQSPQSTHYFIAPNTLQAKPKLSKCYSQEHLVVLQNKLQMCHICHSINEEHIISRPLQKVPFQIYPRRSAGIISVFAGLQRRSLAPTHASAPWRLAPWQQSFKMEGTLTWSVFWRDSGFCALPEECPNYQLWGDHLETGKTLCFYWHHFQWSVLPSLSPSLPSPFSSPPCLCFHIPAPS